MPTHSSDRRLIYIRAQDRERLRWLSRRTGRWMSDLLSEALSLLEARLIPHGDEPLPPEPGLPAEAQEDSL